MKDDRPLDISPRQLRALAHPLRIQMVRLLRTDGAATATSLAKRLGESTGATSYHLRQLAAYGLIEEDPEHQGHGRERWWRSAFTSTRYDPATLEIDAETRGALEVFLHTGIAEQYRRATAFLSERAAWPRPWREAADFSDYRLDLTPDRLKALAAELETVIARYRDDPGADSGDAREVTVGIQAFPRPTSS